MDLTLLHLRLAGIEEDSIVDGPGLRLTVFTQGCHRNCRGCHNPHTHDPAGGYENSLAQILEIYRKNPLLSGITFSGGEPFLQAGPLAILGEQVHELGGNVLTYTGYTFEELASQSDEAIHRLLDVTDVLIDGPFVEEQKNLELKFRGSENQRVLDRNDRKALMGNLKNRP